MWLNLPFEVKNELAFYKVRWLKYTFLLFSIFNVFRIFEALQIFFYKFLLKWEKIEEDFESSIFLEAQKVLFCFWIEDYFFFQMVIFATLFRRCPTLWMTTLKMTTLFGRFVTLFNSRLLNVVNFNFDVHNVVSTLLWRCATSPRHINLKAKLNRRWNVCWAES